MTNVGVQFPAFAGMTVLAKKIPALTAGMTVQCIEIMEMPA